MRIRIIMLLMCFAFTNIAFAQIITGKVVEENQHPINGVKIVNLTKKLQATTLPDGSFSIKASSGDLLVARAEEFEDVSFAPQDGIQVVFSKLKIVELQEVVAVGYGIKKNGALTAPITTVKAADLVKTPAQSIIQAMQGRVAGVNIVTNDEPGGAPTIQIRGLGTLYSGRDPLYIIDGVESSTPSGINPNDIEKVDVLKDASSLSIYGNKAANGVIFITTKKGKKGRPKVEYSTYYGLKTIQREVEMSNTYYYAYYANSAEGSTTGSKYNGNSPVNTNWLREITGLGYAWDNNLSISGGTDNVDYYLGVSHYNEKGILNGSAFDRTNLNNRNQYRLFNNRIKVTQNLNISLTHTTPKPLSVFTAAYKQAPMMPVKYVNGRYAAPLRNNLGNNDISGDRYNNVGNPVAMLEYHKEKKANVIIFGNVGLEGVILDNLNGHSVKFNSNFGLNYSTENVVIFEPLRDIWLANNPDQEAANYPASSFVNKLTMNRNTYYRWNWDNFLTYQLSLGKLSASVVLGVSYASLDNKDELSVSRNDVPDAENYWSLSLSQNSLPITPGSLISQTIGTPSSTLAYFMRIEGEYDNKYLVSFSVRREGMSKFRPANRWGLFPAVSVGWVLSNEAFFALIKKVVTHAKVRAGYGEVGNGLGASAMNSTYFTSSFPYSIGGQTNVGSANLTQIDPNLTWESMKEYDVGLDIKFLQSKLSATVDMYYRTSSNLIIPVQYPTVISPERVTVNAGEVVNQGVEVSVRWTDQIGSELSYAITCNFSYNDNKLERVTNPFFTNATGGSLGNGQWVKEVHVGQPLASFNVFETRGFDNNGQFIYSNNRVYAGSYLPVYNYAINLSVNFKGFDFSADVYGVGGNKVFNGKKAQRFGGENVEKSVLSNFWIPSNTNAVNPYPSNEQPRPSTYYIEDGSYLRLNNVTLGYTFNNILKMNINLRMYASVLNAFVITQFTGYSPEITGNGAPLEGAGIELDVYPTNRTYVLGLRLTLQ